MAVDLTLVAVPALIGTVTGMGFAYLVFKLTISKWYGEKRKVSTKAKIMFWGGVLSCIFISQGAMQIGNELFYVLFNDSHIKAENIYKAIFALVPIPAIIFFLTFVLSKLVKDNFENVESVKEDNFIFALNEIKTQTQRDGLWAQCLANSEGNDKKAESDYIRLRSAELSKFETASIVKNKSKSISKLFVPFVIIIVVIGCFIIYLQAFNIELANNKKEITERNFHITNCNACYNSKQCLITEAYKELKITGTYGILKVNESNVMIPETSSILGVEQCKIDSNKKFSFTCERNNLDYRGSKSFDGNKTLKINESFSNKNVANGQIQTVEITCEVTEK